MSSLDNRITKLEDTVTKHLTESGEIRQSIKELSKAVKKISDRMWGALITLVLTLLSVVGYLLKVSLWR